MITPIAALPTEATVADLLSQDLPTVNSDEFVVVLSRNPELYPQWGDLVFAAIDADNDAAFQLWQDCQ